MSELPEKNFNQDTLYSLYKQTRNTIRKYSANSILAHAIDALYKAAQGGVEILRSYQPWNILLLIKWTLQEADSVSHRRPSAKLNDFIRIQNRIYEMQEHVRLPDEYEHVVLFLRHLAFQQFWLQQPADAAAIARQEILFCHLPKDHPFQRDFLRLTGVSCTEFTQLSLAITAMFVSDSKRRAVRYKNFSNFDPHLISRALVPFLSTISKDIPTLHKLLNAESERKQSIADQMILPSPLVNFPFLQLEPDLIAYYPKLLFRSLESFIYRTLKKDKPIEFPARFGSVFEKYVEDCFADATVPFINESALAKLLLGSGKCVDFLVVEDDCNILIDAKGVEISHLGLVSHKAEVVFRSLKASVQKAINQGLDTARRIALSDSTEAKHYGKSENYLLVVTYDSLNLGSNTQFVQLFGQKVIDAWQIKFGNPLPIPVKNFFFLEIDELERLLVRVSQNQTTILGALRHAQKNDSNPATHKFSFNQHLESISPQLGRLPRLQAALDKFFNTCTASVVK